MTDSRVRIGVWATWEQPVNWTVEGILRVLAFLVEGAAIRGDITFCIVVSPANHAAALQMLRGLRAREGDEWILVCNGLPTEQVQPAIERDLFPGHQPPAPAPQSVRYAGLSPKQMRWLLTSLMAALIPVQLLRVLLRPLWRVLWQYGLAAVPRLISMGRLAWRDPVAASAMIASVLEHKSWPPLRAAGNELRQWHIAHEMTAGDANMSPSQRGSHSIVCYSPATRSTLLPETDGWLLLRPDAVDGLCLPGRKVALFPDAIPFEFPFGFAPEEWRPGGKWDTWKCHVSKTLAGVDAVATFSGHVAKRHVAGYFSVTPETIKSIPWAHMDLRPLLPAKPPTRASTPESRLVAAALLRDHASERGWPYLQSFPFEDVPFIVVSTQDRPTKNIPLVVEAVRRLLRRDHVNLKLLMTARLPPGQRLTRLVHDAGMGLDALSLPFLPPNVHAALYHCGAVTVHPSFFEGGIGVFPFAESVSLGTPCVMARGPHTLELVDHEPACSPFLFDPYDVEGLVALIRRTIDNRQQVLDVQVEILERLLKRSWADVAKEYAAVISGKGCSHSQTAPFASIS